MRCRVVRRADLMHKGGAVSSPVCVPESTRPCLTLRCGLHRSSLPCPRAGKERAPRIAPARGKHASLTPEPAARKGERLCCCPRAGKERARRRAQKRGSPAARPHAKPVATATGCLPSAPLFAIFFGSLPRRDLPHPVAGAPQSKIHRKTVFHYRFPQETKTRKSQSASRKIGMSQRDRQEFSTGRRGFPHGFPQKTGLQLPQNNALIFTTLSRALLPRGSRLCV